MCLDIIFEEVFCRFEKILCFDFETINEIFFEIHSVHIKNCFFDSSSFEYLYDPDNLVVFYEREPNQY